MSRISRFEIQTSNPQLLMDFYASLLGWKFQKWGELDYWLIDTDPGDPSAIEGGLMPRPGPAPVIGQAVNALYCTVEVANIDQVLEHGLAHGATLALPKMAIPGVGWYAYLLDPDGNIFGLSQPDQKAA
jgi:predicted enzyme related to lactoylglutathione lyase